jgi:hypothetical protein
MISIVQLAVSVGTFIVFVSSAIIGLRQLRSNRRSNQLAGLQAVAAGVARTDFQRWFAFVLKDLPNRMADPAFRDGLRENPIDRVAHPEIQLADWYEEIGILANYGVVDEAPLLEFLQGGPQTAWRALEPTIALYREIWGFSYFRNFERLAERSRIFYAKIDLKRIPQ